MAEPVQTTLQQAGTLFSGVATKLAVGLIIFLIGIILGKLLEKLTLAILRQIELNRTLRKAGVRLALEETIAYVLKYAAYLVTIVIVLNHLNLSSLVANIVAGALLVVIFASILLSIKDFFPNFIAGMAVYRKGIIHTGDRITYRNIDGTVTHAGLLEVKIMTPKGDELYIPTSALIKSEFLIKHRPARKK